MTLIARPTPPTTVRPELATPRSRLSSCGCEPVDPDLVRLRALLGAGMGQWEASRLIWSPNPPPEAPAPAMAQLDPGRWARQFVRYSLAKAFPWLRLPTPTEVA